MFYCLFGRLGKTVQVIVFQTDMFWHEQTCDDCHSPLCSVELSWLTCFDMIKPVIIVIPLFVQLNLLFNKFHSSLRSKKLQKKKMKMKRKRISLSLWCSEYLRKQYLLNSALLAVSQFVEKLSSLDCVYNSRYIWHQWPWPDVQANVCAGWRRWGDYCCGRWRAEQWTVYSEQGEIWSY